MVLVPGKLATTFSPTLRPSCPGGRGRQWARAFTPTHTSHFFPTENPYGDTQGYWIRDRVSQGIAFFALCPGNRYPS